MKQINVFNTINSKLEPLNIKNNKIKWYTCGPTVYDSPHIGHGRTYIVFDAIRRIMEKYYGINVYYAMNITDIDDKIINKGNELLLSGEIDINAMLKNLKLDNREFSNDNMKASIFVANKYEKEFFEEMDRLNVKRPDFVTHVFDYIPQIIKFIEKIIENGYAYVSNGSVYFDLKKYKEKYKLIYSNDKSVDDEKHDDEKRNAIDFALWKNSKPHELFFESPWGKGRPGWHIECSVMASDVFEDGLDIHSGGVDLKFPHHENEIVQCKAHNEDLEWVKYFLHSGHLEIDGCKMSKSLKNFITIPEILKKYKPRTVRMVFLLSSYDAPMMYQTDIFDQAEKMESKLFNFLSRVDTVKYKFNVMTPNDKKYLDMLDTLKIEVDGHLRNNFRIHLAITALYDFITKINKVFDEVQTATLKKISAYLVFILDSFGLIFDTLHTDNNNSEMVDYIAKYRSELKKLAKLKSNPGKFFELTDKIRDEMKSEGYLIEDNGDEYTVRKNI